MENLTNEMLEKYKADIIAADSAEKILTLAKQNGIEMTTEKAEELYARYHKSGELNDDELDNVAGGGGCRGKDGRLWVTLDKTCAYWERSRCIVIDLSQNNQKFNQNVPEPHECRNCLYLSRETGLLFCDNDRNRSR